jgi:hypothetical protein
MSRIRKSDDMGGDEEAWAFNAALRAQEILDRMSDQELDKQLRDRAERFQAEIAKRALNTEDVVSGSL